MIELTDVPLDRGDLVAWQGLRGEPPAAGAVEQVGMRTTRDEVCVQDRLHLVLEPGAMPHDLIAARHQTSATFRLGIGRPDLRQVSRRMKARQHAGIDLVGLHMSMGDRLHLQRVGDDHPRDKPRQHPRDRHGIAGGFDHHLVGALQALAETLEAGARHVHASGLSELAALPDHHLAEGPVDVYSNNTSHSLLRQPK